MSQSDGICRTRLFRTLLLCCLWTFGYGRSLNSIKAPPTKEASYGYNFPDDVSHDEPVDQSLNDARLQTIVNALRRLRQQASSVPDKRGFDSIENLSDFGGFSKRGFDPIEHLTDFGGFSKRGFDSIEHLTDFGGFSKRAKSPSTAEKRGFDSIEHLTDFGGFGKRGFDSIEHLTDFGGFSKRAESPKGSEKRGFDSIEHLTDFGGFGKRGFDSIEHFSDFGGFGKRGFDSIEHLSDFGKFGKRSFDSIEHSSLFGGFGKRNGKANNKAYNPWMSLENIDDKNQKRSSYTELDGSQMSKSEQLRNLKNLLKLL